VVLHLGGIRAVVVHHSAVLRDQRQTVGIYRAELLQLLPDVIHRRQVAALRHQPPPQTGVNCQQQQPGRQQQRDKRCDENAAEYALSHVCSPMR